MNPSTAPWLSVPPICSDCQDKSYAEMAAVGCTPASTGSWTVNRWKKLETSQTSFYLITNVHEEEHINIHSAGCNGYFCDCPICWISKRDTKWDYSYVGYFAGMKLSYGCYTSNGTMPWTLATAEAALNAVVDTQLNSIQVNSCGGTDIRMQSSTYSSGGGTTCTASCGCVYEINTPFKYNDHAVYTIECTNRNYGFQTPYNITETQKIPLSNTVVLLGSDNSTSPISTVPSSARCSNECCDCGFGLGVRGEICGEPWGCCRTRHDIYGGESCEITRRNGCNVGKGDNPYGGVGALYTTFTPLGTGEKTDYTCDGCTSVYVGLCVYTGKNQTPNTPVLTCTASLTATAAAAIVDVYPPNPDVYQYLIVPENSCSECPANPPSVEMEKWCIKDSEGNVLECSSVVTTIEVFQDRWIYWAKLTYNNAIAAGINPPCVTTVATWGNQLASCASCVDTTASTPVKKCCIQDLKGNPYYCANSTYCECRAQQVIADATIKALDPYDAATIKWETPLVCSTDCIKYTGACCLVLSDGSLYECTDGKDFAECEARAAAVNELLNLPYPDGDYVTWQWLKGIACSTNPCI